MTPDKKKYAEDVQEIAQKISALSGLKITLRIVQKLQGVLLERLEARGIKDPKDYLDSLLKETSEGKKEISILVEKLENFETSFFRDRGLFDDLKRKIIPELVSKNSSLKRLKIWSAGCSSGEETLSLAMVLNEALIDSDNWQVSILGTDISSEVIAKAKRGKYPLKSLHNVDIAIVNRFFNKEGDFYFANSNIMKTIDYKVSNLVMDAYGPLSPEGFDLILCRNAFIYFTPQAIEKVVLKMSKVLKNNGILISGHGELIGVKQPLKMELLTNCVIFRN